LKSTGKCTGEGPSKRINCFEDDGNQRLAKHFFGGDIMTKPVTKKQVMRLVGKQIIAVKKDGTQVTGKLLRVSGNRLILQRVSGKKVQTKAIIPLVLFDLPLELHLMLMAVVMVVAMAELHLMAAVTDMELLMEVMGTEVHHINLLDSFKFRSELL